MSTVFTVLDYKQQQISFFQSFFLLQADNPKTIPSRWVYFRIFVIVDEKIPQQCFFFLKLSNAFETRPVENKGNDYLIKKLLTVKQILLVSISWNVWWTVGRIFILMLRGKGLVYHFIVSFI